MSELGELGRRALNEIGDGARGIGEIHLALADRVFGATGPGSRPVRVMHDALTQAVYTGVRGGARLAAHGAALALPDRPVADTPRGAATLAILNGLIGDTLEAEGSPLAQPMRIGRWPHRDSAPVTGHVAVFVHGLMESERSWGLGGREPYGERLDGWTSLYLRYNSGRRISRNGLALAEMLERELADWPVEIERIALIGHSMGGLVARSAGCHATESGAEWVKNVREVVSLGTPHLGAPLEQGVHRLAHHLDRLPETRPAARFLRRRSGGIRDLRHGSLVDSDWEGRDPEALKAEAIAEVPLLDGARHYFVSACVTRNPRHPVGRLVGDMLVLGTSASGTSRRRKIGFDPADGFELGGTNHLALLNHPKVHAQLARWLG